MGRLSQMFCASKPCVWIHECEHRGNVTPLVTKGMVGNRELSRVQLLCALDQSPSAGTGRVCQTRFSTFLYPPLFNLKSNIPRSTFLPTLRRHHFSSGRENETFYPFIIFRDRLNALLLFISYVLFEWK